MALDDSVVLSITDYKTLLRGLNKLEPGLAQSFKENLKDLAEIPRAAIRDAIPSSAPISGMRRRLSPVGKTWNTRSNARTVTIKMASRSAKPTLRQRDLAIVKLQSRSPATIIADMAGRGNVRRSGKTEWYTYPKSTITTDNYRPSERRHTVTTQGDYMIRALDAAIGGNPSRMFYKAAEKKMPEVAEKANNLIQYVINEVERTVND